MIFMLSLFIPQIIVFVISISWHLFRTTSQSAATSRLQKQFFFAMCLQVFIPIFVLAFPVIYIIMSIVLGYFNQGIIIDYGFFFL